MKPTHWISLLSTVLLMALVAYFLSEPDQHRTQRLARNFAHVAVPGTPLAEAVHASPDFKSVSFGVCGHLDASPDSGPKGSLIFSPAVGSFARYSSFDEFLSLNPTLIGGHPSCRDISVLYETVFPYRGQVDLKVDDKAIIREVSGPVFFD